MMDGGNWRWWHWGCGLWAEGGGVGSIQFCAFKIELHYQRDRSIFSLGGGKFRHETLWWTSFDLPIRCASK